MSYEEKIVTGRKYRRILNMDPQTWERISFWKKASDIEFSDGRNLQDVMDALEASIASDDE